MGSWARYIHNVFPCNMFSLFTGGKIKVKIITAGYYDDKDEGMQVLSDEDTAAFKNMIIAVLVCIQKFLSTYSSTCIYLMKGEKNNILPHSQKRFFINCKPVQRA